MDILQIFRVWFRNKEHTWCDVYVHLIAGSLIDIFQNYKCLSQSKEAYLPQFYKQGQALVFNLEAYDQSLL